MKTTILLLLMPVFLHLSVHLSAREFGRKAKPGWTASVGFGIGVLEQKKLTRKTISSYDEEHEITEQIIPLPQLEIAHFDKDAISHWKFSTRKALVLERHQGTGIGMFVVKLGHFLPDLGFDANLGIFENPYLLNEERQPTKMNKIFKSISYLSDRKYGVALGYYEEQVFLENDTTHLVDESLGRDGTLRRMSLGFNLLFLNYRYLNGRFDAEGGADSFDGTEHQLMLMVPVFTPKVVLIARATQKIEEYREVHPVFSQVREDTTGMNMIQILFKGDEFSFFLMALENKKESNIRFFNESKNLTSVGVRYRF